MSSLTFEQEEDFDELIAERHLKSSFIITSNRKIEAWVGLFPDPVMGNAVVDRFANNGHHLVLEGESYRRHLKGKMNIIKQEADEKSGINMQIS